METGGETTPAVPAGWGRRLRNFIATDSGGRRFEYYRDLWRGPTVLLAAPEVEEAERLRLAVGAGVNLIALAGGAGDGVRRLLDPEGILRRDLFGGPLARGRALLADANQRLVADEPLDPAGIAGLAAAAATLVRPPVTERRATAPVLLLPALFDPSLRRRLIAAFEADHREGRVAILNAEGVTALVDLPDRKRRRDRTLDRAEPLYAEIRTALAERLMPELWKAWWIDRLRPEAFYTACYEAGRGDFFAAHRDNNLPGTAARRIAVSVELNDDYAGGGLVFPEYSDDRWRAPAGGGLAFSCSLLHEAVPVTEGRRYVLLAFLAAPT